MRLLKKVKVWVSDLYGCISMAMVLGILAVMTAQAFCRYVLNESLTWSEELARFMFVWASMTGAVAVTANRGHAAIKMLDGILPMRVNQGKTVVFDLVMTAIGTLLLVQGITLVNSVWQQTSAAMKLPYAYVYMAIPVGGFGIMIQSLINCVEALRGEVSSVPSAEENTEGGRMT